MFFRFVVAFAVVAIGFPTLSASAANDSGPLNDTVKIMLPVHLKDMPREFTQWGVQCSFRYVGGTHGVLGNGTEQSIYTAGGFTNGAFDGTVPLTIKRDKTPPDKINGYFCVLSLYTKDHGTVEAGPDQGVYLPKPGTPFAGYVDGGF